MPLITARHSDGSVQTYLNMCRHRGGRVEQDARGNKRVFMRSEEHTSELQSLMRISYAVFCLKKKKKQTNDHIYNQYTTLILHHYYTIQHYLNQPTLANLN